MTTTTPPVLPPADYYLTREGSGVRTEHLVAGEDQVRVPAGWRRVMDGPRSAEGWPGAGPDHLLIRLEGQAEHEAHLAGATWRRRKAK